MFSPEETVKRPQAIRIIRDLGTQIVLSTQVLQEFYSVGTRKMGIDPQELRRIILELQDGEIVATTPELVVDAIDLSIVTRYTIWDSLILQAAIQSRCARIFTEDLNHGQTIRGLRIENPFR